MLLLHLEIGDSVAEKAADSIVLLENSDCVTGAGELLSGSQASGT
jgi:hypothetical protein